MQLSSLDDERELLLGDDTNLSECLQALETASCCASGLVDLLTMIFASAFYMAIAMAFLSAFD